MAKIEIATTNRDRYARARVRGKARVEDSSAVVDARYDAGADSVELRFRGGGSMSIPRAIVPGLERASASKLEPVVLSPTGGASVLSGRMDRLARRTLRLSIITEEHTMASRAIHPENTWLRSLTRSK